MHCTVKPGKYCICSPSVATKLRSIRLRPFAGGNPKSSELPLAAKPLVEKSPGNPAQKSAGQTTLMAGIWPRTACGVKRKGYNILWLGCGRVALGNVDRQLEEARLIEN